MNFRFYLIIIFFLAAGLIVFFLVWPKYQNLLTVQSEIGATKEKIQTADKRLAELKDISQRLKQYENQLKILDTALPNKFYLPQLHDFFQNLCPRYGLILEGINISVSSSEDNKIQEIAINLNVSGSYSSIKDFLSGLENSVRFFSIEKIGISSPEKENAPFKSSLNLKTYTRLK